MAVNFNLTNTCSVLGSVQKICDITGGDHLLIQLGDLSRDVLKVVLSKFGKILQSETGGFLTSSPQPSPSATDDIDTSQSIIEEVIAGLVNSTVENQRQELIDRRLQIKKESYDNHIQLLQKDLKLIEQMMLIDGTNCVYKPPVEILPSENIPSTSRNQFNSIINRVSKNPDGIQAMIDLFSHISSSNLSPDLNVAKNKNQSPIQDESPVNIRKRLRNHDSRTPKKSAIRKIVEEQPSSSSGSSSSQTNLRNNSTVSKELIEIVSNMSAHDVCKTEDGVTYGHRRGKTEFVCSKCEWKTTTRALLILHSSESHGIGKTYKCADCAKVYTVLSKYQKHREDLCTMKNGVPLRKRAKSCVSS
ncbi:unnamed protein product [Caenorhabditis angaria]|uniref:C2H2-type domain-containing protein n=1 Tax=Caenorhabditis angaria TaxID=860376 RepID=A0A9P1IAV8_9PELO|nr:unnamed protein product [Caenorhabditis angaria]